MLYSALSQVTPGRKSQSVKSDWKEQQDVCGQKYDYLQGASQRQRENSIINKEILRNNDNNFHWKTNCQNVTPKGNDHTLPTYFLNETRNLQNHERRDASSTLDNHCNIASEKQRYFTNHNRSLFERLVSETSSVKCMENVPKRNLTPHFTSKHTQFFPENEDSNGNYNTHQIQG